jgi:hypothetical protein
MHPFAMRFLVSQNGLEIHALFIFKLIEVKNTFMYFQIVHIIVIIYQISNVKIILNTILNNQFKTYF